MKAAIGAAVKVATGAAVKAATVAAVEAATGAATKVTAAVVCCGSVRGATEVAVVNGAWAEFQPERCRGHGGGGGHRGGSGSGLRGSSEGNRGSGVLRQASNMDFIGGEARGGANGVVIGILWCSLQTMANI